MNKSALKNLWQESNEQLETAIRINKANTDDITRIKAYSLLSSVKPVKVFALVAGICWVLFLDSLLFAVWNNASPFFVGSALIQTILTKIAIGVYVYQLILINQTDLSEPIMATQERLSRLQSSTLWITRLLFLQLPVWTTFYWNNSMIQNGHWALWLLQVLVTAGLIVLAVWLFFNIRYKNREKRWFRWLFQGKEWEPLLRAMDLLKKIEEYK
jgi:hypothetical protein